MQRLFDHEKLEVYRASLGKICDAHAILIQICHASFPIKPFAPGLFPAPIILPATASRIGVCQSAPPEYAFWMRPLDIQQIGEEVAVKWDDGTESFIRLEKLRRFCPCAGCKGEMDIMGNLYKGPEQTLGKSAIQLRRISNVGGYGIQPVWGDGHGSGIYSYDYLKHLADSAD